MNRIKLTEDYRHFDTLIWQAPSVGVTVAVGVVVAANSIGENGSQWEIRTEYVKASILIFGFFLLSALSIATAKYRLFQMACLDDFPKPPFGEKPSAGAFLQGAICLTNGILLGLALSEIFACVSLVPAGIAIGVLFWFLFEKQLKNHRDA